MIGWITARMAGLASLVVAAGVFAAGAFLGERPPAVVGPSAGPGKSLEVRLDPKGPKPEAITPAAANPRLFRPKPLQSKKPHPKKPLPKKPRPRLPKPGAAKHSTPNMDHVVGEELC